MSTSPPAVPLSRRSLLRGAASVAIAAALAGASSCADDADPIDGAIAPSTTAGPLRATEAGATPLLWLGHELSGSPAGAGLAAGAPPLPPGAAPPRSDADAVRAVAARDAEVREDLSSGATVLAAGWALSHTEGEVLVAYAGTCPLPSC